MGRHRLSPERARTRTARSRWVLAALTILAVFSGAGASWGYWSAAAAGTGSASTATLSAPVLVSATAPTWSDAVVVSWSGSTLAPAPLPAPAYYVTRVRESDGSISPACGTSRATPTAGASCTDEAVPDGAYRYLVTAVFRTWTQSSAPSQPVVVASDRQAPRLALDVSPANEFGIHAFDPVSVTLNAHDSDSGVASISYAVDGAPPTTVHDETATVNVTGEGTHVLSYVASDTAGNSSPDQIHHLTIDTVSPAVSVSQGDQQPDPSGATPVVFTVRFTEPVSGFAAEDVTLSGTAGATTASITGGDTTYTILVGGMTRDGSIIVSVPANAARDAAGHGNTASTGGDATVTRDTEAPGAPTAPGLGASSDTGASSSDRITQNATPTLVGSAEEGSRVTLFSNGVPVGSTVVIAGTYAITTSTLPDGAQILTAHGADAAGNTSALSSGTVVTVDTLAPAAPSTPDVTDASDTGVSATDNTTKDNTPTVTGTAEPGSTVTLSSGPTVVAGPATGGSYAFTTPLLTDGAYTFNATATDLAGNTSPPSNGTAVTVDTVAPTPVMDAFGDGGGGQATATGTAGTTSGDDPTVTVVLCSANSFPCSAGSTKAILVTPVDASSRAWSTRSANLRTCILLICTGPGTLWAQAAQGDAAGNLGATTIRSAIVL